MTEHGEYMDYQRTGILGAYRPEEVRKKEMEGGKVYPLYPETEYRSHCDMIQLSREMVVGGRLFRVHSIFSFDAKQTPTEAMLRVIDNVLEKDSHSG